jgi:hypothetical protein
MKIPDIAALRASADKSLIRATRASARDDWRRVKFFLRSSFNHHAHFLCAAQEMSESQILNANPRCEDLRQSFVTHSFDSNFCLGARWHKA